MTDQCVQQRQVTRGGRSHCKSTSLVLLHSVVFPSNDTFNPIKSYTILGRSVPVSHGNLQPKYSWEETLPGDLNNMLGRNQGLSFSLIFKCILHQEKHQFLSSLRERRLEMHFLAWETIMPIHLEKRVIRSISFKIDCYDFSFWLWIFSRWLEGYGMNLLIKASK